MPAKRHAERALSYYGMKKTEKPKALHKVALFAAMVVAFLGGMMGIMNFHTDVEMSASHQTLYRMVTGREVERPLAVSIPYTLGLGIGIWLFLPDSQPNTKDAAPKKGEGESKP